MVRCNPASDAGMTLVEIMITLVVSSIIAASTFMFFAGQQHIYETQTKLLNIQQNLWASMEVVARYARAAGSGMYGCVRPASYYNATLDNGSRVRSVNPSGGPLAANLGDRPQTGIRAYDVTTGNMQWIPPLWIVNNSTNDAATGVVPNTDVLTVAFGNQTSGTDYDVTLDTPFATTGAATAITLAGTNTGNMFRRGEFILLLNRDWGYGNPPVDRGCTMFQNTSTDPNNTVPAVLAHNTSAINPGDVVWNPGGDVADMLPAGNYTGGGSTSAVVRNFGQLTWVTFFIKNGSNGIPNLMMWLRHKSSDSTSAQILAEGIEDFQVSFACDTGTLGTYQLDELNGLLDEGTDDSSSKYDEWWNNVPGDNLPAANTDGFCNLPTAVRLTMVARSLAPDDLIDPAISSNGPMDVEDHRYSSPRPTDQYRRRVLSTTVYPRNNKAM